MSIQWGRDDYHEEPEELGPITLFDVLMTLAIIALYSGLGWVIWRIFR